MAPREWSRSQVLPTAIPAALVIVPLAVLGIFKPFKINEALGSLQAMAIFAGIAVVWIALALLLWRFTNPVARGVVMGVLSVALAAVLIVPSLRDVQVVENRDDLATVRVEPDATTTVPAEPMTPAMVEPPAPTTTQAPTGPVHVGSGELRGIGHGASGTANLFLQPEGTYVVELLDIDIDPGPDYIVYVAPGYDTESPGTGAVELAPLKGNVGTQYYDVPPGVDMSWGEWSVLVWCRAFAVPVAAAPLYPV